MALNTFTCNYLTPLHFKGLKKTTGCLSLTGKYVIFHCSSAHTRTLTFRWYQSDSQCLSINCQSDVFYFRYRTNHCSLKHPLTPVLHAIYAQHVNQKTTMLVTLYKNDRTHHTGFSWSLTAHDIHYLFRLLFIQWLRYSISTISSWWFKCRRRKV